MTPKKYIIYTEGAKTQNELRRVSELFNDLIKYEEHRMIILPNTYHIELLSERPQPGRAKRKNRNT